MDPEQNLQKSAKFLQGCIKLNRGGKYQVGWEKKSSREEVKREGEGRREKAEERVKGGEKGTGKRKGKASGKAKGRQGKREGKGEKGKV